MLKRFLIPVIAVSMALSVACGDRNPPKAGNNDVPKDDMPLANIKRIENISIFFAHRSVGNNIIDGIRILAEKDPDFKPEIIEIKPQDPYPGRPSFVHALVGRNGDPIAKIDEFYEYIDKNHKRIDVAFLKLCYADFEIKTDNEKVFEHYKNKMHVLKNKYPKIRFIHFTVPLTTSKPTMYSRVKKIIGKKDISVLLNEKRNIYNELVRKEYAGKEPVFDLAEIESTSSNGSRTSYWENGKAYYVLSEEYAADRGHLNDTGKKKVARKLVEFILGSHV